MCFIFQSQMTGITRSFKVALPYQMTGITRSFKVALPYPLPKCSSRQVLECF